MKKMWYMFDKRPEKSKSQIYLFDRDLKTDDGILTVAPLKTVFSKL